MTPFTTAPVVTAAPIHFHHRPMTRRYPTGSVGSLTGTARVGLGSDQLDGKGAGMVDVFYRPSPHRPLFPRGAPIPRFRREPSQDLSDSWLQADADDPLSQSRPPPDRGGNVRRAGLGTTARLLIRAASFGLASCSFQMAAM
ncbi:hypothetical protein [Streptomyces sp. NBC_00140]|uniref:hypothetical protein n=1 Tax=Streptomyces sp. NBC_00140 TaxID=2975664 RepID=UPI0022505821|nr:hypothetical protein [Streptomyces sp. NBC_00140]MCX5336602.1 hypothetical protein [Streptomyces sp. NBC_00140]